MKTVSTQWEVADYDVWGNAEDGFEVNNVFRRWEPIELEIPVHTYNVGTEQEFESAYPTEEQIREALGIIPEAELEIDGDDLSIYVNHAPTGEPLGEMFCLSHESLSPIRVKQEVTR